MLQGQRRSLDGAGRVGAPETDLSFVPPDELELQGQSGEALVKWKRVDDRIVITSMDGVTIGDQEEGPDDDSDEDSGMNREGPGGSSDIVAPGYES